MSKALAGSILTLTLLPGWRNPGATYPPPFNYRVNETGNKFYDLTTGAEISALEITRRRQQIFVDTGDALAVMPGVARYVPDGAPEGWYFVGPRPSTVNFNPRGTWVDPKGREYRDQTAGDTPWFLVDAVDKWTNTITAPGAPIVPPIAPAAAPPGPPPVKSRLPGVEGNPGAGSLPPVVTTAAPPSVGTVKGGMDWRKLALWGIVGAVAIGAAVWFTRKGK